MINKTKKKPGKKVKILFWLVIALSVITAGFMFTNFTYSGYIKNVFLGITALIGLLLIIFSSIEKLDKLFKSFLILTGASALGFKNLAWDYGHKSNVLPIAPNSSIIGTLSQ